MKTLMAFLVALTLALTPMPARASGNAWIVYVEPGLGNVNPVILYPQSGDNTPPPWIDPALLAAPYYA